MRLCSVLSVFQIESIMKIEIVTFRGRTEADNIADAQRMAKDLILDIITDGQPEEFWWAQIFWHEHHVCRTWSCPEIGVWQYSGWLPMYQPMLNFES